MSKHQDVKEGEQLPLDGPRNGRFDEIARLLREQARAGKAFENVAKIKVDPQVMKQFQAPAMAEMRKVMKQFQAPAMAEMRKVMKQFQSPAMAEMRKTLENVVKSKVDPQVMKQFMLAGEAATHLGVTRERLRQLTERGVIKPVAHEAVGRVYDGGEIARLAADGWQGRRSSVLKVCVVEDCEALGMESYARTTAGLPIQVRLCARHLSEETDQFDPPGQYL